MRLLAKASAFAVLAALISAAGAGGMKQATQGRLLIELSADGGGFKIERATAFPGAAPPAPLQGNQQFRIVSETGEILAAGRIDIPAWVCQERTDESGAFFGRAEPPRGTVTLELPYIRGGGRLELLENGRLLLRHDLKDVSFSAGVPMPAAASASPADFGGFLAELEARQKIRANPSRAAVAAEPAEEEIDVGGRIKVAGVRDGSLLRAEVSFYREGEADLKALVESGADGRFSARLPAGRYLVSAGCYYKDPALRGGEVLLYPNPQIISGFDPGEKNTLRLKWKLNRLFRGKLMVQNGGAVQGRIYVLERNHSGSSYQPYFITRIDTDHRGGFALRLPARRFVMIALPNPQEPAGELLTIVQVGKESRLLTKLVCPRIGEAGGDQLKKIWDAGDESARLNLVFMAEAYTEGLENFTDANGNGIWDGDLLLDENGNGRLDNGEYYNDRNRNGAYDEPEPFEDLNGDLICNRYERAKFEADAALAAAALLNFHPYDDYDDAINIYTWWVASEHGTQTFTDARPWSSMNTYFGVYCYGSGDFQSSAITVSAKTVAQQWLPAAKEIVPVVLVQDPFDALRANSSFNFGRILLSAEDSRAGGVLIHELGHSVGGLWDEYLYDGASGSPSYEPSAANVTRVSDPARVKWADLISGTPPVPTPIWRDGYGLFEGAMLYTYGIYRPTGTSMMRSTSYPYFLVNARRLSEVLSTFR